jgi:hypothetical protein
LTSLGEFFGNSSGKIDMRNSDDFDFERLDVLN